ncbi:MAG: biopolymer transporter ExbD [Planctomycetes bacterium]|nr:biopolymer transporter ExbD [Planctomycetota bacterium]
MIDVRRSSRLAESRAEINMAPLLDMVFILLIFFLVTTSFVREESLKVDRPGATSSQPARGEPIPVTVRASGRIEVDGRPVSLSVLRGMVRQRARGRAQASALVIADRAVTTDLLVRVLDECRLAGVADVAIATARRGS